MPRSAGASGEKKEFKFVTATEFCRTHLLDSGDSSRALEQGTAGGACALGSARPFCAGGVGNYGLGATARDRAVRGCAQQKQACRTVVTTPFSAVGVCRDDAPQDARAGDGNVHAQLWDCRCGTVVATPPRTRARGMATCTHTRTHAHTHTRHTHTRTHARAGGGTAGGSMQLPECPTIYPSAEEWEDFEGVIKRAEQAALRTGIVKVVPPASWKALESLRRKYAAIDGGSLDFTLPSPVLQRAVGQKGVFRQYNMAKNATTLQAYKALAQKPENRAPPSHERELDDPAAALHKKFWASLGTQSMTPPLYAADVADRSLFDHTAKPWDVRDLDTLLQRSIPPVKGVTCATLFVGMWRTAFAWHTEDYDLSALNFHHMGAPKHWYGVPAAHAQRFQAMCAQLFPGQQPRCKAFLRHKHFIVSPSGTRERERERERDRERESFIRKQCP